MKTQRYPTQQNGTLIPYEATFDELCENLKTPGPLAWESCIAISHIGTQAALDKLVEISQHPDWRFRRCAIEALAYHPQGEQAIDVFQQALHDPSQFVIRTTCQVIGKLKIVSLHDPVLNLLNSNIPETKQEAVRTLKEIWLETDFDIVFNLSLLEPIEKIRKESAWVLRAHTTDENWRQLFMVWWQDSAPRHRQWACELTFEYNKAGQVEKELKTLLADKDGHVRKKALKVLTSLKT